MGATAHDGCQSRPRHVRNLTHATDDRGVRSSGLGVVNGGESGGDTGLPCGDGDVPGFESGDGTRRLLNFFGGRPGARVVTVMMVR